MKYCYFLGPTTEETEGRRGSITLFKDPLLVSGGAGFCSVAPDSLVRLLYISCGGRAVRCEAVGGRAWGACVGLWSSPVSE